MNVMTSYSEKILTLRITLQHSIFTEKFKYLKPSIIEIDIVI